MSLKFIHAVVVYMFHTVAFGARGTTMGAELIVVAITLHATSRWYAPGASHNSRLDRILLRDSKSAE